ncbi:hypothetical protein ON010_g18429 [Phytophthora cinnamomi]|nr:hypothetical protein ON010_g18429 [Phytophthora cinnamomi]
MKQALQRAMKRYAIPDDECNVAMTRGVIGMLTVVNPDHVKSRATGRHSAWTAHRLTRETIVLPNDVDLPEELENPTESGPVASSSAAASANKCNHFLYMITMRFYQRNDRAGNLLTPDSYLLAHIRQDGGLVEILAYVTGLYTDQNVLSSTLGRSRNGFVDFCLPHPRNLLAGQTQVLYIRQVVYSFGSGSLVVRRDSAAVETLDRTSVLAVVSDLELGEVRLDAVELGRRDRNRSANHPPVHEFGARRGRQTAGVVENVALLDVSSDELRV